MTEPDGQHGEDLVVLKGLVKSYTVGLQQVTALDGLTLTIAQGQYVAIMGPSGSGKSTLLNILGCLDRPSGGHYFLGGQDVSGMDDNDLSEVRNTRIGFIFQSFNLIRWLTVTANIEVPLFYQGVKRRDRHPRSRDLAKMVGLEHRMNHRPWELSGGQQQRVAIARALANDPLILLADEPTGNLDSHTTEEILSLFEDLHRRGRTIIMVTHEDSVAHRAGRIIRLRDGRVETDVTR
ncbi:MAG: ABC transporter ATP-binding protein [Planctomycetaceae bacterium]|nr:ABC transporter ATP-binding protein [Planctomycetaceae bacterium]